MKFFRDTANLDEIRKASLRSPTRVIDAALAKRCAKVFQETPAAG